MIFVLMGNEMAVRGGALGHFGNARRAAVGSTLVERVVETGDTIACGSNPHRPIGRRSRWQSTTGNRCDRRHPDAGCRGHRPDTRRQNSPPAKPSSTLFSRLAFLDRCAPRWLELPLQATGTKNHASRMGTVRLNGRRLRPRYPGKCVNPVGRREGRGRRAGSSLGAAVAKRVWMYVDGISPIRERSTSDRPNA